MAEPDDLYTLRQEFYVGNFQVRRGREGGREGGRAWGVGDDVLAHAAERLATLPREAFPCFDLIKM